MLSIQSQTISSITLQSYSAEGLAQGEAALQTIASRPRGGAFLGKLESLSSRGQVSVFIGTTARNSTRPTGPAPRNAAPQIGGLLRGSGSDAEINWNPNRSLVLNVEGIPLGHEDSSDRAYLSLGHELVHAYRIVKGKYLGFSDSSGFDPSTPKGKEELYATGLGVGAKKSFSENVLRQEHQEQVRTAYPISQSGDRLVAFDGLQRVDQG